MVEHNIIDITSVQCPICYHIIQLGFSNFNDVNNFNHYKKSMCIPPVKETDKDEISNSSPIPSTSTNLAGLNADRLRLSPKHDASDSDIDDPSTLKSPTTLQRHLTDLNCSSRGHYSTKKKVFKTSIDRNTNTRKRISDIQCTAQDCDRYFISIKALWRHLDIDHLGKKPYTCDTCGKAFAVSSSLKIHKRIHTGEKPFVCDTCGKAFSDSSNLTTHKRTHTGQKPCICDICSKAFSQSGVLRRHKRNKHPH
jgi:uncharacterized Zn-finger protein